MNVSINFTKEEREDMAELLTLRIRDLRELVYFCSTAEARNLLIPQINHLLQMRDKIDRAR